MGQKVNPNGFRYGISKDHNTNWYSDKAKYADQLIEDQKIYRFFDKLVRNYQIGNVQILRDQKEHVIVKVHTAKPGVILGTNGDNVKELTLKLKKYLRNRKINLNIEVVELKNPDLNAKLLAEGIAEKLENRGSFRLAQKFAIRLAMKAGAKGIKTAVSGRLNGVDMARKEGYNEGEMKLHTLRQDVDYATATARTTYGALGIKVWVSLGEKQLQGDKDVTTKKN
ncbi:30S ribosomal protein S3 [Mycoplasma zalophi]|uniref:30S ribosomal protein S3 n=1 Tax=Mycoplasma zalophi TaxID=191287 RepID=UPI001C1198BD|nr:30S ribosomal protein S3 [Mycoplasma zalophi]MBU4691332.1 30S ribosomal protein S3 [Mycoplasma zalophi]